MSGQTASADQKEDCAPDLRVASRLSAFLPWRFAISIRAYVHAHAGRQYWEPIECRLRAASGSPCPGALCGAICNPSLDRPTVGLGRKKAVISAAFISSTPRAAAWSVGFAVSNLAFTWSQ